MFFSPKPRSPTTRSGLSAVCPPALRSVRASGQCVNRHSAPLNGWCEKTARRDLCVSGWVTGRPTAMAANGKRYPLSIHKIGSHEHQRDS